MSQHDYNIANGGGAAVRADINNALLAILSQNSGATAPAVTKPFMPWYDTTTGILKIRNAADNAWVTFAAGAIQDASIAQAKLAANVAGNGPAFSAIQSTPQALSSGVFSNIQCQTENFDTNGCFNNTGSTVTLNGISTPAYAFAPNVAGYYQVNAHINCTLASSQELIASIYKNGSSLSYIADVIGGATRSANGSYLVYLNGSSDYIQFYGYINTNTNVSIAYFQASMVRAA